MIYKSYCSIDIEYYPFDIQNCYFKFGSWTYDGNMINLEHINEKNAKHEPNVDIAKDGPTKVYTVDNGIDMSDYYTSVEWDVLAVPAQKNIKYYLCCPTPYYDIYFNITIRRKTLFYTVNLIIPCVNISFLSVLVFFLPSDSGEKLTLGISILVALLVFYLLLIELIPPTSLVIPLIGKYLLFTLILVNLSILLTIFVLNLHHRKPSTHKMPYWMKRLFLNILPKMLMIERPMDKELRMNGQKKNKIIFEKIDDEIDLKLCVKKYPLNIIEALKGLHYINKRMKKDNQDRKVS
jgi:nicotinic acetylcholine receptor